MAKYLLLKHYRGGPAPAVDWAPMDQWTPDEVDAHMRFMHDFGARLEETGELVDAQALSPDGAFVRYDGEGRPPVTDGPFVETKDLVAGWYVVDVESWDRAVELAGELSAAPGRAVGRSTSGWRSDRSTVCRRLCRSEWGTAAGPRTGGDRGSRPAWCGFRVGRGCRAGRPGRGGARVAGESAAGPPGLVDYRGLA